MASFGTIQGKGVVDEVGRAKMYEWNIKHGKKFDDKSPDNPFGYRFIDKIKSDMDSDLDAARVKYPEIFYYYDGLMDTKVSQSVHPAGMVISPISLRENYGVFDKEGDNCLMMDMEEAHEVGAAKYDFLVLKTVQVIRDTCRYMNRPYPKTNEINWLDQEVWEDIIKSPIGVFQFESAFAFDSLKKFKPKNIFDMSLVTAAIRPSGSSYRDELLARKPHHTPSKIIDDLLADNLGYLCIEGNQKVDTKRGFIPIKDVRVGDFVKTRSGFQKVLDARKTGHKELLDLNFLGNHLLVTPEHKVLTDRGWVESKSLNAGDVVAYRVGDPITCSNVDPNIARTIGLSVGSEIVEGTGVPFEIMTSSVEAQLSFLRAYTEVNGHTTVSKRFAYDLQTMTRNLGLTVSIHKESGVNGDIYHITTCKADECVDNIAWTELEGITPHESADVYDITVENEHEFVCQGIIVHNCYQEDTIKFLQQICGLSGSEADNIRRAIGRKQKDRLEAAMPSILEGYCSKSSKPRNEAEKEAKEFLQIIEDSASYQFG